MRVLFDMAIPAVGGTIFESEDEQKNAETKNDEADDGERRTTCAEQVARHGAGGGTEAKHPAAVH